MSSEVKISELAPVNELYEGCCFPLVQYDETRKITYQTLKNQLDTDLGGKYTSNEVNTGRTWLDGKPIYKKTVQATIGTIAETLEELNVDKLMSFYGMALSNWGQWWTIPCVHSDNRYDIYFFKSEGQPSFGFVFGSNYSDANLVYCTLEYTKLSD